MSGKIDKSIPRKMFDHEMAEPPDVCPQCGAHLVQDFGPYMIATRRGSRLTGDFAASGPIGYLCPECPTAVIHIPELSDTLYSAAMKPGWDAGPEFAVMGILDLDAVPPDKSNAPLEDVIPYAFVPFESAETEEREPVDTAVERTLYFAADDAPPENCPECERPLLLDYGPYLVRRIYQWRDDAEFAVEGPFGYLCPGCATAVIHMPALVDVIGDTLQDFDNDLTLTVLGRFNLEDVPPEQLSDPSDEFLLESLVWYPHGKHLYRRRKKRPRKPKPKRRRR
jgi:rubrerythrin